MDRIKSSTRASGDRRSTVSGALPDLSNPYHSPGDTTSGAKTRLSWSSPSAPSSPSKASFPTTTSGATPSPASARRGIFSKFNSLLKSSGDDGETSSTKSPRGGKSRTSIDDDSPVSPVSPNKGETAMAAALSSVRTRRRKGSLRKAALLGGKKAVIEGRERKNSLLQRSPTSRHSPISTRQQQPSSQPFPPKEIEGEDQMAVPTEDTRALARNINRPPSPKHANRTDSIANDWVIPPAQPAPRLSLVTEQQIQQDRRESADSLGSPLDLKSPTSQASYTSTTDDDDMLTFDRPAKEKALPLPSSTSYFPPISNPSTASLASHRRSSKKVRPSPLSHTMTSLAPFPDPEPHDYTETEYWGWVILFITWLTFTVGMGSCLEIWSWAWDVGETPYAPPDLQDDATLPIVGYYPAVMVLTGVVAWVWITVAWVGMKYFRHAKIEV